MEDGSRADGHSAAFLARDLLEVGKYAVIANASIPHVWGERTSVRSLRRDIEATDSLASRLSHDYIGYEDYEPPSNVAALPTNWVAPFAGVTDSPWSSVANLPSSNRLVPIDLVQRLPGDAVGHEVVTPGQRTYSVVLAINALAVSQAFLLHYRQSLLRLVNGIRAILRLMLIRVLSALARCPDTINAILVLLAASRCFGYRTEPGDCAPPVFTSKSVVIGEPARLC